jgi:hypothetical protein
MNLNVKVILVYFALGCGIYVDQYLGIKIFGNIFLIGLVFGVYIFSGPNQTPATTQDAAEVPPVKETFGSETQGRYSLSPQASGVWYKPWTWQTGEYNPSKYREPTFNDPLFAL